MSLIQLKRTLIGTVPSSLADGELMIDQKNGLLYWADSSGVINSLNLKSSNLTAAQLALILGYTPYNGATNPNGFLTSVSQAAILSALGFTPANSATLGTASSKNTGTAAGNVVMLDANGKLPAVDGSQLTNIGLTGFRNKLINGIFAVDQRNNGASVNTPNNYTVDRWAVGASSGTYTVQRTGSPGNYALVITATTTVTSLSMYQRISALDIAYVSGPVTLSTTIAASANLNIPWSTYYPTAVDNYTATTSDKSGNWAVTTTPTRYSTTFTPTSTANGYAVNLINGLNLAAGQSITISNVQFEPGSSATPIELRPYSCELGLSQRYCLKLGGNVAGDIWVGGYAVNTLYITQTLVYPVVMRATPTVTQIGSWTNSNVGNVIFNAGINSLSVQIAAQTVPAPVVFATTGTSTYLLLTAEL